jgi:hypothetical protein
MDMNRQGVFTLRLGLVVAVAIALLGVASSRAKAQADISGTYSGPDISTTCGGSAANCMTSTQPFTMQLTQTAWGFTATFPDFPGLSMDGYLVNQASSVLVFTVHINFGASDCSPSQARLTGSVFVDMSRSTLVGNLSSNTDCKIEIDSLTLQRQP